MGAITVGANTYPRVQFWSIADHFKGIRPHLPARTDPMTGREIAPRLPETTPLNI